MSDTAKDHYKNLLVGAEPWAIEQIEEDIRKMEDRLIALVYCPNCGVLSGEHVAPGIEKERVAVLRKDIQAAKDRDQYRENLLEELKADRTRFREQSELLKKRVLWFVSFTEGMLCSEQVTAILEESK